MRRSRDTRTREGMTKHDRLQLVDGGKPKTLSLTRQGLFVLGSEKEKGAHLGAHCTRGGPCPCVSPCVWGQQALDDLQRDGWPSPGPRLVGCHPEDRLD